MTLSFLGVFALQILGAAIAALLFSPTTSEAWLAAGVAILAGVAAIVDDWRLTAP